jgi:hypothetical protein
VPQRRKVRHSLAAHEFDDVLFESRSRQIAALLDEHRNNDRHASKGAEA